MDKQAIAGSDYTATSGTLSFAPGESLKTFTIPILSDAVADPDETFTIELRNATGGLSLFTSGSSATVTIVERVPIITVADVAVDEGNRISAISFTITSDTAAGQPVSVDYRTLSGTARGGEDFVEASGRAVIPAGLTSVVVATSLLGDIAVEDDETFRLQLSNPSGAAIGRTEAVATLRNDDGLPVITADDVEVTEGTGGALIHLRRTKLNRKPTSVNFPLVPGTAQADRDYDRKDEYSVSFGVDETQKDILVSIRNDEIAEARETFFIELFGPDNAILPRDRIPVTIVDDNDTTIVAQAENISVEEGDSGSKPAVFTVRLSKPSDSPFTVPYRFAGIDGTSASDFTGSEGTLTFAPGETEKNVSFSILGDTVPESSEQVVLVLGTQGAYCTIVNDDGPVLSIADATVRPTYRGTAQNLIELKLDAPAAVDVIVTYACHLDTARGTDLWGSTTGKTGIAAGKTTGLIGIYTQIEQAGQTERRFILTLSNPAFAKVIDHDATITISDQYSPEQQATLSVGDITVEEPQSGMAHATFTLELSPSYDGWAAVDVETTPGTAGETDFQRTAQRVVFAPGELRKTVPVDVVADGIKEQPEWFFLILRNASGVNIRRDIGVATIYDPGQQPRRTRSARH